MRETSNLPAVYYKGLAKEDPRIWTNALFKKDAVENLMAP